MLGIEVETLGGGGGVIALGGGGGVIALGGGGGVIALGGGGGDTSLLVASIDFLLDTDAPILNRLQFSGGLMILRSLGASRVGRRRFPSFVGQRRTPAQL